MNENKFENLGMSNELLKAVYDMGFEEPTPIQAMAIAHVMQGRDVIGQAQTGTGKTAAFAIPILDMVNPDYKAPQVVVLCPTRELAIQVAEEITRLAKYKHGIKTLPVYGGQSISRQIRALKKGVQIIIGTPGRTMDHMRRRTLKLGGVKMVVLDEADEMLSMGFREDIETILQDVPNEHQTIMFSATMPKSILDLRNKYQKNPEYVKVAHKQLTVPNIEQKYFQVKERSKLDTLCRLIDVYNPKLALVFCNTKKRVDELTTQLLARGYFADGLHGDMRQRQRDRVMDNFRNGNVDILVATDVAARGLDVDDIEAVFNYDVPHNEEYYVHRIGRTGRAGRTGQAFTLVAGKAIHKLRDIQKYAKTKIKRENVPSIKDVKEIKTNLFMEKVKIVMETGHLDQYMEQIDAFLEDEDFTPLEFAAALLKVEMNQDDDTNNSSLDRALENTGAEPGMARLFINIGKDQNVRPRDIVGAIAGETSLPGQVIGLIDIHDRYSFVEVPREHAPEVLSIMNNNQIRGKTIDVEPAKPRN